MARTSLTLMIVTCLALNVVAGDEPDRGTASKTTILSVGEVLAKVAKGPIRAEHSTLLKAVACLVEREQPPSCGHRPVPQCSPSSCSERASEQRKRVVVSLSHTPATDVAIALTEILNSQHQAGVRSKRTPRMVLVPEPTSNNLLISGSASQVDDITKQIAQLDARPDTVAVEVYIGEFEPGASQAGTDKRSAAEALSIETDGVRWLAWAEEHRRIKTLARPQVMTLDNQPAFIQVGQRVPLGSREAGSNSQPELVSVGLIVGVTPRVSPEGQVLMELDLEHVSIVNLCGAPAIQKAAVQTTVRAKSGQTTVLGGPIQRTDDGDRQLVLALTPCINPTR